MPTPPSPILLELTFDCVGDEVRIGAHALGQPVPPRSLGVSRAELLQFASAIQQNAALGQSLPNAVVLQAQAIQKAVLADEIGRLFTSLRAGMACRRQSSAQRASRPH